MGADLVGQGEQTSPKMTRARGGDPRTRWAINVGDCAGRGAILFESTVAEISGDDPELPCIPLAKGSGLGLFPLIVRSFGLIASILAWLRATSFPGSDCARMKSR